MTTEFTPNIPRQATPWHIRLLDWLRCERDKLRVENGLVRNAGRFRVLYTDLGTGIWSEKMTYESAKNYASMFGGTVYWIGRIDPASKEKAC